MPWTFSVSHSFYSLCQGLWWGSDLQYSSSVHLGSYELYMQIANSIMATHKRKQWEQEYGNILKDGCLHEASVTTCQAWQWRSNELFPAGTVGRNSLSSYSLFQEQEPQQSPKKRWKRQGMITSSQLNTKDFARSTEYSKGRVSHTNFAGVGCEEQLSPIFPTDLSQLSFKFKRINKRIPGSRQWATHFAQLYKSFRAWLLSQNCKYISLVFIYSVFI